MRLLCMGVPSKMVRLGLTRIDLIIQIYYFLCGFCDFCEILLFFSHTAQNSQKGCAVQPCMGALMRCCRGSRSEDVPSEMANHA